MNQDHERGGGDALTPELALALLASELHLAKQLEQESASHLAMALTSDLEPELRKVLVEESQKVKELASAWMKEMEMVLQKAQALVKAQGSRSC
jgi:hypothetical protein